jgi:cbb3-type cytochrome oxidase maturation protein
MSIIYILIPIAVLLTSIGIYLFFWAVKTEQFEDLEKQGMSILFDKEEKEKKADNKSSDNHDDLTSDNSNSDNSTSDIK